MEGEAEVVGGAEGGEQNTRRLVVVVDWHLPLVMQPETGERIRGKGGEGSSKFYQGQIKE